MSEIDTRRRNAWEELKPHFTEGQRFALYRYVYAVASAETDQLIAAMKEAGTPEARAVMAEGQSGEAAKYKAWLSEEEDDNREARRILTARAEAAEAQLARVKEAAWPLLKCMVETETWDDKSVLAINVGSLRALRAALAASPDNAKPMAGPIDFSGPAVEREARVREQDDSPPVSEPIAQGRAHEFKVGDEVIVLWQRFKGRLGRIVRASGSQLGWWFVKIDGDHEEGRWFDAPDLEPATPIPPPDLIEEQRVARLALNKIAMRIPESSQCREIIGIARKAVTDIEALTKYGERQ